MATQQFAGTKRLIILLLTTALFFGCTPYELKAVLDGPQGKGLSISPSATVVATSSTFTFSANGGVGPYTYALLSGGGSVDPMTGVYTAPSTSGSAVIRVTDTTGKSVDALVTVDWPPDNAVSFDPNIPWSGAVGTAMSSTGTTQITIQNGSTNPGHANIQWYVYLSTKNVFDASATLIRQGTIGPLTAGASSVVTFAGTWPSVAGVYYLIAAIQSSDDSNVMNNVVIGHVTAIGDFRYLETGPNGGSGPYPGTLTTTTDNTATTLLVNQTLVVEGAMKASSLYSTFSFSLSSVLNLNVQTFWTTGSNDINTYVWDSTGNQIGSTTTGIDMEPAPIGTFTISGAAAGVWYVGEKYNASVSTGQKYVILIKGQ